MVTCDGGVAGGAAFAGSLFGRDRIGHTTPDARVHPNEMVFTASAGNDKLPTLHNQAVSRLGTKKSSSNVSMSRSGVVSKSSSSYNAATVR